MSGEPYCKSFIHEAYPTGACKRKSIASHCVWQFALQSYQTLKFVFGSLKVLICYVHKLDSHQVHECRCAGRSSFPGTTREEQQSGSVLAHRGDIITAQLAHSTAQSQLHGQCAASGTGCVLLASLCFVHEQSMNELPQLNCTEDDRFKLIVRRQV